MDRKMKDVKMTSSWAFWNIEPPTVADEEDTRIPIRTVSDAPEEEHEDVCIHCLLNEVVEANKDLKEANENLAVELYEIKGSLEFLIKMLGGK